MKILLFSAAFLFFPLLNAQQVLFEKIFGDPGAISKGYSVKQFHDGTIFFAGDSNDSLGDYDLVLTRMDEAGNTQWTRRYGTAEIQDGAFLCITPDSNLVLLGGTIEDVTYRHKIYLAKLDTSGTVLWERSYQHPLPSGQVSLKYIEPTPDSGFIACGYSTQADLASNDFYVVKFDEMGFIEWEERYGFTGNEYAQMVRNVPGGGFIISGDSQQGTYENYVVKTDDDGNVEWDLIVGDQYVNGNQAVLVNDDGSYILSGESTTAEGPSFDIYLVKISPAGQLIWAKYCGYTGTDAGFSILHANDGSYLLSGYSNSYTEAGPVNFMLAKTDTSGYPVGVNYYNQPGISIAYEMIRDRNQNYLLAGFTGSKFYLVNAKDSGYAAPFINHVSAPVFEQSGFSFYPNPSSGYASVEFPSQLSCVQYLVTDMQGKTILSGEMLHTPYLLHTEALAPGTYLLLLRAEGFDRSGILIRQ